MTTNTHELIEALDDSAKEAIRFALTAYTCQNSRLMDCDLDDAVRDILDDLARAGFTVLPRQALASQPQAEAQPGVGELAIDVLGDHLAESIEPFLGDRYPYESTNAGAAEIIETLKEAGLIITPVQPAGDVRVAELAKIQHDAEAKTAKIPAIDWDKASPFYRNIRKAGVEAILAALSATPTQSGWRPGLDGAPLDATPFFVWYVPHKGSITPRPRRMTCRFRKSVLEYRHSHGWFTLLNGEYIIDGITHWMPEPLPPQNEGGDDA
jgi:hypothetical protein